MATSNDDDGIVKLKTATQTLTRAPTSLCLLEGVRIAVRMVGGHASAG